MLKCDFCGVETDTVSRVALDVNYDRLTVRHVKMYACAGCALKKEKERSRLKPERNEENDK